MKARSWIIKPLRPATVRDPGPSVWGEDEEIYGVHPDARGGGGHPPYTPIGEHAQVAPPDRVLDGYTMFPHSKVAQANAADLALRQLGVRPRHAAADRVLKKLGLR